VGQLTSHAFNVVVVFFDVEISSKRWRKGMRGAEVRLELRRLSQSFRLPDHRFSNRRTEPRMLLRVPRCTASSKSNASATCWSCAGTRLLLFAITTLLTSLEEIHTKMSSSNLMQHTFVYTGTYVANTFIHTVIHSNIYKFKHRCIMVHKHTPTQGCLIH